MSTVGAELGDTTDIRNVSVTTDPELPTSADTVTLELPAFVPDNVRLLPEILADNLLPSATLTE